MYGKWSPITYHLTVYYIEQAISGQTPSPQDAIKVKANGGDNYKYGQVYSYTAPQIDGHELVSAETITGNMPSYDTSISFVYKVNTHKVSGTIKNVEGSEAYPLSGFRVSLTTTRTPSAEIGNTITESYQTLTDSMGAYSFANVPEGATGKATITYSDNSYQPAETEEITVGTSDVEVSDVSVEKYLRDVKGTVSIDNDTLKNATIEASFADDY